MLIEPPPPAVTRIAELLLILTLPRLTFSGKIEALSSKDIVPASASPPNSIFAPGATICPPSNITSPPNRLRLFPGGTAKPLALLATELFVI